MPDGDVGSTPAAAAWHSAAWPKRLSMSVLLAPALLPTSCAARGGRPTSSFKARGRGGLPPAPSTPLAASPSGSRWSSKPPPDRQPLHRDHRKRSNRSRCLKFHNRSSAPPASRAGDSRPDPRSRGAGPMNQAQERCVRTPPHPLYGSRGRDSSYSSRATGADFWDRNSLPAERVKYPHPRNSPFLFERRVPGRKFVTAVACLGKIRRRQSPSSGSGTAGKGMRWMPLQTPTVGGRDGISHPRHARSGPRPPEAD
jgi:hypothetical protein